MEELLHHKPTIFPSHTLVCPGDQVRLSRPSVGNKCSIMSVYGSWRPSWLHLYSVIIPSLMCKPKNP